MPYLQRGTFGIFPAQAMEGLDAREQIVLCWLWFHKNQEGVCWPSLSRLSIETGLTRRTIYNVLPRLVRKGRIEKTTRRKETGDFESNMYLIGIGAESQTVGVGKTFPQGRETDSLGVGKTFPQGRENEHLEPYKENQKKLNQKNTPPYPQGGLEDFRTFWEAYPKKVARKKAEQIWMRLQPPKDLILAHIESMKKTNQWLHDNGKYIPHPTTYLNQERWNDEIVAEKSNCLNLDAII